MINVVPENDLEEHEETPDCKCKPIVEVVEDEIIVIHNSFDGREYIETLVDQNNISPN